MTHKARKGNEDSPSGQESGILPVRGQAALGIVYMTVSWPRMLSPILVSLSKSASGFKFHLGVTASEKPLLLSLLNLLG